MRMNFEIEIFTHNLSFIKIKGVRRGYVAKIPSNPPEKLWRGILNGNKSHIRIYGSDLQNIKYENLVKEKPPHLGIYC
jgi:hypothetical protein